MVADQPQVGETTDACELFAGTEYGWPLWRLRSFVCRLLVLAGLGVVAGAIKIIHPLHPYRVYAEGSVAIHRRVAATSGRVPTRRPVRVAWAAVVLLVIAAYLGACELVDYRPMRDRL